MPLLHPLIITISLATLTLALPTTTFSKTILQPRDDGWSKGIPANGVNCSTSAEANHLLDSGAITAAITSGANNQYSRSQGYQAIYLYPKPFDTSSIGTVADGQPYTIDFAEGCNSTKGLYYVPISYPGFSAPAYSASPNANGVYPTISSAPQAPISADIVLFVINSFPNAQATVALSAAFCAVLTNSDAAVGDGLYVGGGLNMAPGGYHQCNAN